MSCELPTPCAYAAAQAGTDGESITAAAAPVGSVVVAAWEPCAAVACFTPPPPPAPPLPREPPIPKSPWQGWQQVNYPAACFDAQTPNTRTPIPLIVNLDYLKPKPYGTKCKPCYSKSKPHGTKCKPRYLKPKPYGTNCKP